jgi:hypothetical protein
VIHTNRREEKKASLFGHLQGAFVHVPLDQWLGMVESRPVPSESGEAFDMRIVSTDVTGRWLRSRWRISTEACGSPTT